VLEEKTLLRSPAWCFMRETSKDIGSGDGQDLEETIADQRL
jgi:hypothetical protein